MAKITVEAVAGPNGFDDTVLVYDVENEIMVTRSEGTQSVEETAQVATLIERGILKKASSSTDKSSSSTDKPSSSTDK